MSTARAPSWAEVISQAIDHRLSGVWTALPGRVESYDASSQTVAVQPVVQDVVADPAGALLAANMPQLPRVPVCFPQAGGYYLTFPLQAGDTVLLVFCARSLDRWRTTGRINEVPSDQRMHDLSDAIAIPGIRPSTMPLAAPSVPTDHMAMGQDGGASIHFHPNEVRVGGDDATAYVALANLVTARLDALMAAINTHTHAVSGAAVLATTNGAVGSNEVAATMTKAK